MPRGECVRVRAASRRTARRLRPPTGFASRPVRCVKPRWSGVSVGQSVGDASRCRFRALTRRTRIRTDGAGGWDEDAATARAARAAAFWFGLPAAQAAHCGACRYPTPCVAPEQCCPPVDRHRVAYQPVSELQTRSATGPVNRTVYEPQTVHHLPDRATSSTSRRCRTPSPSRSSSTSTPSSRYTVNRPVYETHLQEQRYTVMRPVVRDVPGRDPVLHLPAGVRAARPPGVPHLPPAGRAGVPGRGPVLHLPAGVRAARPRRTPTPSTARWSQEYQVPVPYTVNRPVYEQHVREHAVHAPTGTVVERTRCRSRTAPTSRCTSSTSASTGTCTYRTEVAARTRCHPVHAPTGRCTSSTPYCVPVTTLPDRDRLPAPRRGSATPASRSTTERVVKVCTGRCETVTRVRPRPGRDPVRARLPGTCVFDPCTCTTPLLPRPGRPAAGAVPRPDRLPEGLGAADRVPDGLRDALRLQAGLPHGPGPGLPDGRRTPRWCRCCYTTCRMVPEQHVRYETRTHCYRCREEQVCQIPYTTCRMVRRAARPLRDPAPLLHASPSSTRGTMPYTTCRMVPETHVSW